MIAANFYKHTEALRFQREMFFNGYKNQPRIMRLMQCVFSQAQSAPSWWNAAKARARDLAKSVKKAIMPLFDKNGKAIEPMTWTFKKIERLEDIQGLTALEIRLLAKAKVLTIDDLADLAVDELTEITGHSPEEAKALIIQARSHWF